MKISVVNQQTAHKWDKNWEAMIRKAVNHIGKLRRLPSATEVNVVIVDSQYMQELNYIYRGIDKSTDVLSFALNERQAEEPDYQNPEDNHLLGDIVICIGEVISQAEELGHSLEREWTFLTVHGMLHLLGYDHEEEAERAFMFSLQDKIMEDLGITR